MRLRFQRLWLALGGAFVLLVIYLSLNHDPVPAPAYWGVKSGHVAAYAWLMYWFRQAVGTPRQRLAAMAALMLMGVVLEFVQGASGYRTLSAQDMLANAVGLAVGWLVALSPLGRLMAAADRRLSASLGG